MLPRKTRASATLLLVSLGTLIGCETGSDNVAPAGDPTGARARIDFANVEGAMANPPEGAEASINALASYINGRFDSPYDRAYAVFRWIRDNVEPDFVRVAGGLVDPGTQDAQSVFESRRAVCNGYAQLLAVLGGKVGLGGRPVTGYGVITTYDPNAPRATYTHVWNLLEIDGANYLVEPSWTPSAEWDGSNDRNYFFLTPPAEFVRRHLPYDSSRQLLDPPVPDEDFWAGL